MKRPVDEGARDGVDKEARDGVDEETSDSVDKGDSDCVVGNRDVVEAASYGAEKRGH